MVANYENSEKIYKYILPKTNSLIDKVKVWNIMVLNYSVTYQYDKGIEVAHTALKEMGIKIPKPGKSTQYSALPDIIKAKIKLWKTSVDSLINLPEITDKQKLILFKFLSNACAPAFFGEPNLLPVLGIKLLNLSLKYGISDASPIGFIVYGIVLCGALGDPKTGFQIGNIGIQLANNYGISNIVGDKLD